MTEGPLSASSNGVASTPLGPEPRDGAPPGPTDEPERDTEDADPVAFLLAGVTRTAMFVFKRVGLSPEVLRSFLQRKAFMRIASTHTARRPSTAGMAGLGGSSNGGIGIGSSTMPFKATFAAQILKSTVMGISVFGVYELAPARTMLGALAIQPVDPAKHAAEAEEEETRGLVVVGYLKAPTVQAGDEDPLLGHVGDGAAAGLAQSVLMDAYEMVVYWWKHRNSEVSRPNPGVVIRRALRDCVGFAALFGTYEVARRFLEGSLYRSLLRSGSMSSHGATACPLATLEKFRVVSRDERSGGAYDASALSMGAAFVAGGVAGQVHLVVNHYTHSLFGHHPPTSRRRHSATSYRSAWANLPKPPKARAVAGAFLPSALCFLALRYGGSLSEWLEYDDDDESAANKRRSLHPAKLLPIYHATNEPTKASGHGH